MFKMNVIQFVWNMNQGKDSSEALWVKQGTSWSAMAIAFVVTCKCIRALVKENDKRLRMTSQSIMRSSWFQLWLDCKLGWNTAGRYHTRTLSLYDHRLNVNKTTFNQLCNDVVVRRYDVRQDFQGEIPSSACWSCFTIDKNYRQNKFRKQ